MIVSLHDCEYGLSMLSRTVESSFRDMGMLEPLRVGLHSDSVSAGCGKVQHSLPTIPWAVTVERCGQSTEWPWHALVAVDTRSICKQHFSKVHTQDKPPRRGAVAGNGLYGTILTIIPVFWVGGQRLESFCFLQVTNTWAYWCKSVLSLSFSLLS